ncbi:MAG: pseudouridine-5'-phosphate glycosidase, partial [Bacteroidota bacterium]
VQTALSEGRPVVALESTIIAHGMPYPQNVATAKGLEAIIREGGTVPATIAVLHGRFHIGLEEADLEYLGQHPEVAKASRRDLPLYLSQGKSAATTVAATMIGAHLAGIRVFATGGIGGVHRGAETSFDISADLQELARTPVAVVSAGAKAILDLGLTLEYLETMGVPVIGYQTDEFPAFYSRESGLKLPHRLDEAAAIAAALHTQWQLGYPSGALVANPVPLSHSLPGNVMHAAIEQALSDAASQQINGKAVTPFLLGRIKDLTEGQSLVSNIELVRNNARLATEIAVALSKIT